MIYEKEYKLAMQAAVQAGQYLDALGDVVVDSQQGKDIKLQADKKSEKLIIDILQETGIPVLSEECGFVGEYKDGREWIIDPLDGTANFSKGIRELACVSVALWENGKPVLGVVNRFYQKEIYSGIVGEGAWLNGEVIHTSNVEHMEDAVLATGFPVKRNYDQESLNEFITKVQNFKKIRMLGTAAIMGALVADGKIDAYTEEQIMLWDIAASSAIVKAAGGEAQIQMLGQYQCICKLFANNTLFCSYQNQFQKK